MKKSRKYRSDFLITRASFLAGAGTVLNVAGNYFKFDLHKASEEIDASAIESDWGVVGLDIEDALDKQKAINVR